MNKLNWRSSLAVVMLLALLLPILAACGGGTATAPTTPPAPEAATTAPAPDAPTTPPAPDAPTTPPAPSGGTAQAGVLRINTESEPDNVDPQKSSFVREIQFIMMAYQALMTFDGNMEPIPAAAESVETSADGLKYTFKLRPDGQYSDGTPVTAQNFEYAWRRLADPETAGEYQSLPCGIIKGYSEYSATACEGMEMEETLARDQDELLANFGVKAIDDLTLEIELVAPAPYFLSMAALWIGAPAREQDIAQGDDWWYYPENYIGNGPFVLTEWDHGNRAVWEPNPNYAGPLGPVALQRVEYYMITESQVAFQAYQNGELDMLAVAPEDLQAVQSDPTLSQELLPVSGSCTFYFGFNTTKAPFEDLKVRQGFAQAFDREAWNRDIFGGLGSVAYSFIPPGFPGYQPELRLWEFDPEAAKAMIAESSYGGVENLPEIKLTYSASARNNARFEWMAGQLKTNLGIDAVLDPIDPTAFSAATKDNPPQMFSLGWCADYPDPQNWISLFQTNGLLSTRVGYSNPEFDALVTQADVEQDPVKRAELYAQAQEILVTDAPVAFTRNDGGYELVKPYVQGVTGETITPIDYWYGFFNLPNVDVQP
ncbi:peptide ABC transporter substrate-binding protein [Candidatus Chloroploca sp. Khr17]|uniref:peptide ABC transporter substrate-binding protein n=1 Tax=Candidatus Chloroploca sp. Khr17 TaxID=2496869 RepID=UPI00101D1E14|nr:peptide ABC transporter substrate-binding protein [Candidatus Chloroploca sp. Khr17]